MSESKAPVSEIRTPGRFDIGEAILWFFKRFGDNPAGAFWIMFWQVLIAAGFLALTFKALGGFYANLFELIALDEAGQLSDDAAVGLIFDAIGPFFTVMPLVTFGGLLFALVFWAAWLRFLTKGEVKPLIPIRIGWDELRLAGVAILYWVLFFFGYIAGAILFAVIGSVVGLSVAGGADGVGAVVGFGLLGFLAMLGFAAAAIFVVVKLSPAPGLNVLDGRFRFFEAWDATKGRFWPLFFSYIVAWVGIMIVGGIFSIVLQFAVMGALWPVIGELASMASAGAEPTGEEVLALFREALSAPGTIIGVGLGLVILYVGQIVMEGVIHGVGAYAAVVHRSGGEQDSDIAPLAADHPAGASPGEG